MADLRMELLAEIGPKTHVSDLCRRALMEINMKSARVAVLERELARLRYLKDCSDALLAIEVMTATGMGLSPEECMDVHILASVGRLESEK